MKLHQSLVFCSSSNSWCSYSHPIVFFPVMSHSGVVQQQIRSTTDEPLETRVELPGPDTLPVVFFCRIPFYHPSGTNSRFTTSPSRLHCLRWSWCRVLYRAVRIYSTGTRSSSMKILWMATEGTSSERSFMEPPMGHGTSLRVHRTRL